MKDKKQLLRYKQEKLRVVKEQRDGEITSMLHTMLRGIINQGDKVTLRYDNIIRIERVDSDHNEYKQMFDVSVGLVDILSASSNRKFTVDGTHISYYMCTADHDNKFEMERLMTLGKVAEFIKDNTPLLVDELNEIVNKYDDTVDALQYDIFQLKEDITMLKIEEEQDALNEMYVKAKQEGGIDVSQAGHGITFWRTQNDEIRRVINFEIIKQSASGKTFTIKLTRLLWNHFNNDTKEEIVTVKSKREHVDDFLKDQM